MKTSNQPSSPHSVTDVCSAPSAHSAIRITMTVWLAAAIGIGVAGVMTALVPPVPQVIILTLTTTAIAAVFLLPAFRVWADTVSVKTLVAVHLTRFVGIYFLILTAHGELPPAFAIPAGWGDIAVATLAVPLLLTVCPTTTSGRRFYFAWNCLGMLDILFVVATATRIGLSAPESMKAMLSMPLCLLVTFLVPVIITSHVLLFRRLTSKISLETEL